MFKKIAQSLGLVKVDQPEVMNSAFQKSTYIQNTAMSYRQAATLLCEQSNNGSLDVHEASVIVSLMRPKRFAKGEAIITEGETDSFMFMVLDGQVAIESSLIYKESTLTVTVFGPGTLVGEMALVDNMPRSATCTATTPVAVAILDQSKFNELLENYPTIAAKLLKLICARIGQNLRTTSDKIKLYSRLVETLQKELDGLMPTPSHIQTNHIKKPEDAKNSSSPSSK